MHERSSTAMTALIITSIVATGVVVAGLLTPHEEPELTVQPTTTTSMPPPPTPEYVLVTPEVEYPTSIPGCDEVEEPIEDSYSSFITTGDPEPYDNPVAPWFSGPKAHLMSEALVAALPSDIEFAQGRIPYFDPIPVYEGADITVDSTNAYSDITVDGRSGYFSVAVGFGDGVPPCVAGDLDERTTGPTALSSTPRRRGRKSTANARTSAARVHTAWTVRRSTSIRPEVPRRTRYRWTATR